MNDQHPPSPRGAHYGDHDNQLAAGTRTASVPARERAELHLQQTEINDSIAQQHDLKYSPIAT